MCFFLNLHNKVFYQLLLRVSWKVIIESMGRCLVSRLRDLQVVNFF